MRALEKTYGTPSGRVTDTDTDAALNKCKNRKTEDEAAAAGRCKRCRRGGKEEEAARC